MTKSSQRNVLRPLIILLAADCVYAGTNPTPEPRDTDPQRNLALGKKVVFIPQPWAYGKHTRRKGKIGTKKLIGHLLTDGKITEGLDRKSWFQEARSLKWMYPGRVNLRVDLGKAQPIDEVAIRFLDATPWDKTGGICMPGWVALVVADRADGPYYKVAEYSKWTAGDKKKYDVPRRGDEPWVHRLRFRDLKTRGRYVGIWFYSASFALSDELYIFKGDHDPRQITRHPDAISDFTVTGIQLYFHKPTAYVTSNITTPLPIGCIAVQPKKKRPLTVSVTMPKGVRLVGGWLYGIGTDKAKVTQTDTTTTYVWTFPTALKLPRKGHHNRGTDKTFARLFVTGQPTAGAKHRIRYKLTWGDYRSPEISIPLETIEIPPQPIIPKRLISSMGWWRYQDTLNWPDWEQAYRHLGFNTIPGWPKEYIIRDPDYLKRIQEMLDRARGMGYRVQLNDNTWHRTWRLGYKNREIFCQFAEGRTGTRICPSYRGQFYKQELERSAEAIRLFKPDIMSLDIELWSDGCVDPPKCSRCRADKAASGIPSWDDWKQQKGEQMWVDFYHAVEKTADACGIAMPEIGVFNWNAGEVYHTVWPIDRFYPEYLQSSQVRFYTPLEPCHLSIIGPVLRECRRKLVGNDNLPWLGTGDFGTFSGETFYYALLECFCNGSRGVNLFSNRTTDADLLAGYARAIRAVAPVEDILVDGELFNASVAGPGQVSGMKHRREIVILAADYFGDSDGTVKVKVSLEMPMRVFDLDKKVELSMMAAGKDVILNVPLGKDRAKVLYLRP